MKEKTVFSGNQHLQELLPLGCWAPVNPKKQCLFRRLFVRYQKGINLLLAISAIGLMFLAGSWIFLIELAEIGIQP